MTDKKPVQESNKLLSLDELDMNMPEPPDIVQEAKDFQMSLKNKKLAVGVSWKKGIIGRVESYMKRRFPVGDMWAKAIPISLISAFLEHARIVDKEGTVKANISMIYIAPSGTGYKTPLMEWARDVILAMGEKERLRERFTTASLTEYVSGTKVSIKGRKKFSPHPSIFILRDEITTLLKDIKNQRGSDILEYLSQLHEGWIEQKGTRGFQDEGGCRVHCPMLMTGSNDFYDHLDKGFFNQGFGNRLLWIVEPVRKPKRHDDDYFFASGAVDLVTKKLIADITKILRELPTVNDFILDPIAVKLWKDYAFEEQTEAYVNQDKSESSYIVKQSKNLLKLAMIYAASRFNYVHPGIMLICKEDMERAIADMRIFKGMFYKILFNWKSRSGKMMKTRVDLRFGVDEIVGHLEQHDGYATIPELEVLIGCQYKEFADEVSHAISKGLIEVIPKEEVDSVFTEEQTHRFRYYPDGSKKRGKGQTPCVIHLIKHQNA